MKFIKFTSKHLPQNSQENTCDGAFFLVKVAGLVCECYISHNTFFTEHQSTTASSVNKALNL